MSENIKDLTKKRASIKGRLTMFINYVNSLKEVLSAVQNNELQLRITKTEQLLNQYDQIQSSIEFLADSSEESLEDRQDFENQCFAILAKAQQLYKDNIPKHSNSFDDDDANTCVSAGSPAAADVVKPSSTRSSVRLPTIQMPKFSGQYEDFIEFRDTFKSLIHENYSISDIQKFHYLRASLEGSAAQVIRSIGFSSSNYKIAWDLLCDRYDNEELLIRNHVQSLFTVDQMKRESAIGIRKIIDTFNKNLRSLDSLGEPTTSWDTLIIYLISSKLDTKTQREWEERRTTAQDRKTSKATLDDLMTFLKSKADLLERVHLNSYTDKHKQRVDNVKGLVTYAKTKYNTTHIHTYNKKCPLCNNMHKLYKCDTFINQSVNERAESVRRLKLCTNCLRSGHQARECKLGSCTKCTSKHNTLLHLDVQAQRDVNPPVDGATTLSVQMTEAVLLSTAVIYILGEDNQRYEARAVLDSASQASFITDRLLRKLNLSYKHTHTSIQGINNTVTQVNKRCQTTIYSKNTSYTTSVSFLILPNITNLCTNQIKIPNLNISAQITLADPEYYSPSDIDILLGADIFWDLIESNQIRLGKNCPILQQTKLGYIISGPTSGLNRKYYKQVHNSIISCHFLQSDSNTEIQEQLTKFWSIEETPDVSKPAYSVEERSCEQHFIENHKRMSDGRFSVAIPLKDPESRLGDSYNRALQCFYSLERRLQKQPLLKQLYTDFMNEYEQLGHMSCITHDTYSSEEHSQFLSHHGVLRESSTTKLRAVFNASAPTTTGLSLNDIQMVGPTIQSDLFSILIRFRHHTYVMTGDIEKMYRQVLIHENQRHLQNIIWRDSPTKELQIYRLNTVTYGTASAPFLAVRCLKQIAIECEDNLVSDIISNDFYVDDLVTGTQSVAQLLEIKDKIIKTLSKGCFNLRKIKSNIPNFESSSNLCMPLNLGQQQSSKTLGLGWISSSDTLCFPNELSLPANPTKRSILSAIGQIFDPLGLLSVFVIEAKILLQKLWLHKVTWDETLPNEITQSWLRFTLHLNNLKNLYIPRCVTCADINTLEIHTFCDSSKDAYGTCVYVRSSSSSDQFETHLLCAKSKVAPLRAVTIPRLELCSAVLAARLTTKVLEAFRLPVQRVFLWTDSSVVLGWLKTPPAKLKVFVKNRVAEIQELTHNFEWRHVPTQQNPADLITRGVNMSQIHTLDTWWLGPSFLRDTESHWPNKKFNKESIDLPEVVSNVVLHTHLINPEIINVNRFSKLLKLKRTIGFVLRFIYNCKTQNKIHKLSGPLSTKELDKAYNLLLKQSQIQSFPEYITLKHKQTLPNKNYLLQLTPFFDADSCLIRVGGRLQNSNFDYNKKHPILISCKNPLSKLIFLEEHIKLYHAAPQLLLSSIRQQFWPLGGRNLARQVVHNCHRCFRMKAQTVSPIMGQLPKQRLDPGYPFETTGVDYAGPILVADRRGRGCKLLKVYIAVFVCFTTKAIHLELVSDLTKESYIATLRRFIARRSKPSTIVSDNGTQFVGAKNDIYNFLKQSSSNLIHSLANEGIEFKFIPARAPHFGGLHEAGVRSVKAHLYRVLGNARLTFEDMYTTLVQIEAILNSRPLTPISSDPNDLSPLTPGHFLVGRPLTALPSPSLIDKNPNRLQRWERVEQLRQHFWIRWHKEFVSDLQQKTKWRSSKGILKEGTMVLLKDDNLPPLKWSVGRIVHVHPGSDGVVRVADVQTNRGVLRRAFNKICPLPMEPVET